MSHDRKVDITTLDATQQDYSHWHTHTSNSQDAVGQLFKRCPQRARPNPHYPTLPYQCHLALSKPIRIAINHDSCKHCPLLQLQLHPSLLLPGCLTRLDSTSVPWNQEMPFPLLLLLTLFFLPQQMAPHLLKWDENVSPSSSCFSRELLWLWDLQAFKEGKEKTHDWLMMWCVTTADILDNSVYNTWPKTCGHLFIPTICDCWTSKAKNMHICNITGSSLLERLFFCRNKL